MRMGFQQGQGQDNSFQVKFQYNSLIQKRMGKLNDFQFKRKVDVTNI